MQPVIGQNIVVWCMTIKNHPKFMALNSNDHIINIHHSPVGWRAQPDGSHSVKLLIIVYDQLLGMFRILFSCPSVSAWAGKTGVAGVFVHLSLCGPPSVTARRQPDFYTGSPEIYIPRGEGGKCPAGIWPQNSHFCYIKGNPDQGEWNESPPDERSIEESVGTL